MTIRDYRCAHCGAEFEHEAERGEAQAFVWDRDRGLQVVINSNVAASTEGEP